MKIILFGIMLMLAGCRAFPTGYRPAATEPPVEVGPLPYEAVR